MDFGAGWEKCLSKANGGGESSKLQMSLNGYKVLIRFGTDRLGSRRWDSKRSRGVKKKKRDGSEESGKGDGKEAGQTGRHAETGLLGANTADTPLLQMRLKMISRIFGLRSHTHTHTPLFSLPIKRQPHGLLREGPQPSWGRGGSEWLHGVGTIRLRSL